MTEDSPTPAGRVLTIAGSDSGGGAGIQADIKTITMLGGFAASAISALTAQNTRGVHDIYDVSPAFLLKQIQAVLSDIGADAVKTGMLPSVEIIETVQAGLDGYQGHVVVDPVMVASSGDILLNKKAVTALKSCLLPRATVMTPNLPEAEVLTDRRVETLDDMKFAADKLMNGGAQAVLIKGGHKQGMQGNDLRRVYDLLALPTGFEVYEQERLAYTPTHASFHGTGCSLASAIATGLAQHLDLKTSVARGIDYVHQAIKTAGQNPANIGDQAEFDGRNGPINHNHLLDK